MEEKYRLLYDDTVIVFRGHTLYRIEALRDFGFIKKGDLGGYVESEHNLSHRGLCWIYGQAKVYGLAQVLGNAVVSGEAQVFENAIVYEYASVNGHAQIYGQAEVYGRSSINNMACIYNHSKIYEYAVVHDNATVCGQAKVYGHVEIFDNAQIYGYSEVYGETRVTSNALIRDANISKNMDYYVGKNIWSSGRSFTYTRSNRKWVVGCFYGTGEELIEKAYQDGPVSGREYERIVNYVEAMYYDLEND